MRVICWNSRTDSRQSCRPNAERGQHKTAHTLILLPVLKSWQPEQSEVFQRAGSEHCWQFPLLSLLLLRSLLCRTRLGAEALHRPWGLRLRWTGPTKTYNSILPLSLKNGWNTGLSTLTTEELIKGSYVRFYGLQPMCTTCTWMWVWAQNTAYGRLKGR